MPSRQTMLIFAGLASVLALTLLVVLVGDSNKTEAVSVRTRTSNTTPTTTEPRLVGPAGRGSSDLGKRTPSAAITSPGDREFPHGSLLLTVVDAEARQPISNLAYVLFSERPREHPIEMGYTDANGQAYFDNLPEDVYLVGTLRSPPYAEAFGGVWREEGQHARMEIVVGLGGAIEGRVVDDAGNPIVGVNVSAQATSRVANFWNKEHEQVNAVDSVTDGDGKFRIESLASEPLGVWIVDGKLRPERWGAAGVRASHNRAGRSASAQVDVGETVQVDDLVIGRPRTYLGRVVTERGKPIEGALVSARWERPGTHRWPYEQHEGRRTFMIGPGCEGFELFDGECLTDASGQFEVETPGAANIRAWTRDGRIEEIFTPPLAPGKQTDYLEIIVPNQSVLAIEVIDETGERVMGRHPLVWSQDLYIGTGSGVMQGLTSVELGLDLESVESLGAEFDLDAGSIEALRQSVGFDGVYWERRSVAHDGDGILRPTLNPELLVSSVRVTVPGYSTGSAAVVATERNSVTRVEVEALPTIGVRVNLPKGWREAVRVLREPRYAWLRICSLDSHDLAEQLPWTAWAGCGLGSAKSSIALLDLAGEWEFPVRDERSFHLFVGLNTIDDARIVTQFGPYEVGATGFHEVSLGWELLEDVPLALPESTDDSPPAPSTPLDEFADGELARGTISFQAVDASTGLPLAGAVLHLEALDGQQAPFLMCDRDGEPHYSKLEVGSFTGRLTADGYRELDTIRFTVGSNKETVLGRLELIPQRKYSGRMIDSSGEPVASARLQVFDSDSNLWAYAAEVVSDDDGRFSFRADLVPPLVFDVLERNGGAQSICDQVWPENDELELRLLPTYPVLVRVVGNDLENETVNLIARSTRCGSKSQVEFQIDAPFFRSRGARGQQLGAANDGAIIFNLNLAPGDWEIVGSARRGKLTPRLLGVIDSAEIQELAIDLLD